MKVTIAERVFEYTSDFPEDWKFGAGDHYKYPVEVGSRNCFIKRFQKARPEAIPGYNLMVGLKNKNERNLARVFDVVQTREANKSVYYIFHEFLDGETLEKHLASGKPVDLVRLTNDLSAALISVHKYGHWFTDLCEKNIFCEPDGRISLIDLDSCESESVRPNIDMRVNMEYWFLVLRFYKEILHLEELTVADIPGAGMNWLQLIFIVLHLQICAEQNVHRLTNSEYNGLPDRLSNLSPSFAEVFTQVLKGSTSPDAAAYSINVRNLILEKILLQKDLGNEQVQTDSGATVTTTEDDSNKPRKIYDRRSPVKSEHKGDRRRENFVNRDVDPKLIIKDEQKVETPAKDSINFILQKKSSANELTKFSLLATSGMVLRTIFDIFLKSYNQKNTGSPIHVRIAAGETSDWNFFIRKPWYKAPRNVDGNKSLAENGLSSESKIFAVRKADKLPVTPSIWNIRHAQALLAKPVIWLSLSAVIIITFFYLRFYLNKLVPPAPLREYSIVAAANDSLLIVKNKRTKLFGYARTRDSSLFIESRLDSAFAFKMGTARAKFQQKNIWIQLDASSAGYHIIKRRESDMPVTPQEPIQVNRAEETTSFTDPKQQVTPARKRPGPEPKKTVDAGNDREESALKETPVIVNLCNGYCDTKGMKGVEISFFDEAGKRYSFLSDGTVQQFKAPCDMFDNGVNVSFKRSGKSERRNVKLKEFEIPELFKDPQY